LLKAKCCIDALPSCPASFWRDVLVLSSRCRGLVHIHQEHAMKTPLLVTLAGLAAAAFSIAAHAESGRPSAQEVPAAADAPRAVVRDDQLGSYARYLMLNGATRDAALVAARNIDRPAGTAAGRRLAANRSAPRGDAQAPVRP
jgi:hypothetical protein